MWTKAAAQATSWVVLAGVSLALGGKSRGTAREKSGSFRLRKSGSKELGVMPKHNQQEGVLLCAREQMSGPSSLEWPFPSAGLVTSGCWLGPPETGAFPVPRRAPGSEPVISRFLCLILASFLSGRGCQARTRGARLAAGSRLQSAEATRAHWLAARAAEARVPGGRPGRTWRGEGEQEAAVRGCCSLPALCAGSGPSAR